MEWGKKEEILLEAEHPYTKALIRAVPRFGMSYENSRHISLIQKMKRGFLFQKHTGSWVEENNG